MGTFEDDLTMMQKANTKGNNKLVKLKWNQL